mmetsp:Transcript_71181/g.180203  ORF Transcript_71181/g.180203 Transcript_71181/m.180203 type:complete len:279 (+) Transcript_71181:807-1643(+)
MERILCGSHQAQAALGVRIHEAPAILSGLLLGSSPWACDVAGLGCIAPPIILLLELAQHPPMPPLVRALQVEWPRPAPVGHHTRNNSAIGTTGRTSSDDACHGRIRCCRCCCFPTSALASINICSCCRCRRSHGCEFRGGWCRWRTSESCCRWRWGTPRLWFRTRPGHCPVEVVLCIHQTTLATSKIPLPHSHQIGLRQRLPFPPRAHCADPRLAQAPKRVLAPGPELVVTTIAPLLHALLLHVTLVHCCRHCQAPATFGAAAAAAAIATASAAAAGA